MLVREGETRKSGRPKLSTWVINPFDRRNGPKPSFIESGFV